MHRIHVMAAVIQRGDNILIARRPVHLHQGGKWEFPGGKLEAGETAFAGLQRELQEELGIHLQQAHPLIRIAHDYPDKQILLDVWSVEAFTGEPSGQEGQEIRWVPRHNLRQYEFPAANFQVVAAAQLPTTYVISPDPKSHPRFLAELESVLARGHRLIQIRVFDVMSTDWNQLLICLQQWKTHYGATFLLNSASLRSCQPDGVLPKVFSGIHLTSVDLMALETRPEGYDWLAASCHSVAEIARAEAVGVDFVTLSPVQYTGSHPLAQPLGWERFSAWAEKAKVPVYGLGGLSAQDIPKVQTAGGQGVAGISSFW